MFSTRAKKHREIVNEYDQKVFIWLHCSLLALLSVQYSLYFAYINFPSSAFVVLLSLSLLLLLHCCCLSTLSTTSVYCDEALSAPTETKRHNRTHKYDVESSKPLPARLAASTQYSDILDIKNSSKQQPAMREESTMRVNNRNQICIIS